MTLRARRGLDFLAGAIVALAVFVLPFSLRVLELRSPYLLAWVLAAGAIVWLVRGPNWPNRLGALIGMGVVTFVGGIAALLVGLWIIEKASLCGATGGWVDAALFGAPAIYAAVAGWALRGRVGVRFFVGPPAGAVLGIGWMLVVLALTHHGASNRGFGSGWE